MHGFWYGVLGAAGLGEGQSLELEGVTYEMRGGLLRQRSGSSGAQARTGENFGFKWAKRDTYESGRMLADTSAWLAQRYLGEGGRMPAEWLPPGARVLDAGCGAGFSSLLLFGERLARAHYLGVDISDAVDVAADRFREKGIEAEFLQADLMRLPFPPGSFDLIFSEGVLHHTDSTELALKSLARKLAPGGRFLFYVYARKGPIREFTDDLIREHLAPMTDEQAWAALRPLTRLGKALGEMGVIVDVPEEIPFLGIPKGPIDLQRLFYWHVFKAFWRPDYGLEELNHVNFDWYRPPNCRRQTPGEVRAWCLEAGLEVERLDVQPSGITVVARRPAA